MSKLLKPSTWHFFTLSSKMELSLNDTLMCGQVFRWKKLTPTSFVGIIQDRVFELKESADEQNKYCIYYRQYGENQQQLTADNISTMERIIRNYFQLDYTFEDSIPNLDGLYRYFSQKDSIVFAKICNHFPGMRIIHQDLLECLISFICSSNNNVSRITLMLDRFCKTYGTRLGSITLEENPDGNIDIYTFPTMEQLQKVTKEELESLGFGYRAGYIVDTIQVLLQQPKVRSQMENEAKSATTEQCLDRLVQVKGVGYKVAACVALYSLQKFDCVPLDVHILNLVNNHYSQFIKEQSTSLTKNAMKTYMEFFRTHFGKYCGFAQMVLYGSQVANFKARLPNELQDLLSSPKKKVRKSSSNQSPNKSKKASASTSPKKPVVEYEDELLEDEILESKDFGHVSENLVRKEFNLRPRGKVNYNSDKS